MERASRRIVSERQMKAVDYFGNMMFNLEEVRRTPGGPRQDRLLEDAVVAAVGILAADRSEQQAVSRMLGYLDRSNPVAAAHARRTLVVGNFFARSLLARRRR
jgi:hypothetical protein